MAESSAKLSIFSPTLLPQVWGIPEYLVKDYSHVSSVFLFIYEVIQELVYVRLNRAHKLDSNYIKTSLKGYRWRHLKRKITSLRYNSKIQIFK